jgi:curli biogenesis system outer membrane secretion channel CsgG
MAMPGRPWNAITRLAAMLGQKRLAGALAVAAIAVAISACGSSDSKSIPQEDADQLLSALTAVQTAIDNRSVSRPRSRLRTSYRR